MRIGIDGHVLGKNIGGVERFVRELVNQLPDESPQHEYFVFVTKAEFARLMLDTTRDTRVSYIPLAFANPLIERLILLPWLVRQYQLDALMVQRLAPWFCGRCKLIVAIHDLTPIKFAQAYKGLSNKLVRLLTKNTIQRADLILTPTQAIRDEIVEYCPTVSAPIRAFYNGVDTSAFKNTKSLARASLPIKTPYVLTVGAIEKRKNLETMFEMLTLLSGHETLQLGVIGSVRDQEYYQALQTQILALGLSQRVIFMGFMDEDVLINVYQNAAVFISASRDEGFNIPPLEAMACGVPVVCSNIAVHQELFTGAALFYDTMSAQDLARQVTSVLESPELAQRHIQQGEVKVAEFTWQKTAKNVAAAFTLLDSQK